MFEIRPGLFAEIGAYKSSHSSYQEKLAVAHLFKIKKSLFEKKYTGFYVLRSKEYANSHRFSDYYVELKFDINKIGKLHGSSTTGHTT